MMTMGESKQLMQHPDVDVLVVGGGPAGIGAGLAAARNGARTLIVEQFNCLGGVATAGRCVSCTHLALGSLRVMVPCIGMGEAAGTAAALSLQAGVTPRALDVSRLQQQLRSQGGIFSEKDIV